MLQERPRFQFSLRRLFVWVLALSILLALTKLPRPINVYLTSLYSALLFAYLGSRSVELAAFMGALGSVVAGCAVMALEMTRQFGPRTILIRSLNESCRICLNLPAAACDLSALWIARQIASAMNF